MLPAPRRWRQDGLALVLYLALALYQTGIGLDAGRALFVGPDPVNDVWSLRWVSANLVERPWALWEANDYFPARDAVLLSEPYLGPAVLVAPLRLVTRNPVLLYNVAVVAMLLLGSYACFFLARRLTADAGAALLAGILVPYCAHQTYHLTHLNILTIAGFPFLLLGLLRLLERPGPGPALLTGLAFAFEAGSSGYHAFSCLFLCLLAAAWGWRELSRPRALAWSLAAAALAALLLAPFVLGFLRVRQVTDTARAVAENAYYSVDPGQDLLRSRALLWRRLLRSPGRPLFPGLVALGFAAVAVLRRGREPRVRLLLLLGAFFLLLALGPELRWNGRSLFPLPFKPLFEDVPLFNAGRHPETYVVPAFLALGLLASLGLSVTGLSRRPVALALVLALATGESLVRRPRRETRSQELPEVYAWLLAQPRGALLEVPFDEAERQWWSIFHGMDIVNGQAPFEPRDQAGLYQRITREWHAQPAADMERGLSVRLLKERFPIRYLVVHADAPEEYRRNLDATPGSFSLLHATSAGDRVYRVGRGGSGRELRRLFRDDQLRAGPVGATLRGPAGAGVVTELNGTPQGRFALDGSSQRIELVVPPGGILRGSNVWTLRLEQGVAGALTLEGLDWRGP